MLLLIREEAGSVEALSCSQADQFEIQYWTELIWNKPLASGWKGMTPFASSEWFLADIQVPLCSCTALGFPSVLKVTWKAWLASYFSRRVTGSALGNSLAVNGCKQLLAMLSALSSPCFYL